MSSNKFERFLPLAGILAAVCFFVSDAPGLEAPELQSGKHTAFLTWVFAHPGRIEIAAVASAFAAFFFLFFVGSVRAALRSRESRESTYSSVAFGAGIAYAGTLLVDALVTFAMGKAGSAHDQGSTLAIGWLQVVDWVPWAAASGVFLLALGLGGLRTLALPKPLAWARGPGRAVGGGPGRRPGLPGDATLVGRDRHRAGPPRAHGSGARSVADAPDVRRRRLRCEPRVGRSTARTGPTLGWHRAWLRVRRP